MKKVLILSGLAILLAVFVSCKSSDNNSTKSDNQQSQVVNTDNTAQNVIVKTFDVKGNCGMCKNRIEKAALSVDGVISADWSIDDKILTLKYKEFLDPATVLQKIADVGHDNEMFTANDNVYNNLPSCCLYRGNQN